MVLTNAERVLLAAYVRAYKEGELRVELENEKLPVRLRFKMYSLAKKVRKADPIEFSEEERFAVEEVSLRVEGKVFIASNTSMTEAFKTLEAALGGGVKKLEDENAEMTAEAMERFKAMGLLKDDNTQT